MSDFEDYSKAIEKAANGINLKEAIKTDRKGNAGRRDKLVFGKAAWLEALTYFAILQSGFIFLGLMDDVINNVNSGIIFVASWVGISNPWLFPLNVSSIVAISFIIFILCFGLVGYRYFGLPKRANELGSKMHPGLFLLYKEIQEIKESINEDMKK